MAPRIAGLQDPIAKSSDLELHDEKQKEKEEETEIKSKIPAASS